MTTTPTPQLIPLTRDTDGLHAVMGRDLHEFLKSGEQYVTWFKRMEGYGFIEGVDYVHKNKKIERPAPLPPAVKTDHVLTMDMAKEISMIQRTDKGKQARQYFLECERQAKGTTQAIPQTYAEALRAAAEQAERAELEAKRAEKAEKKAETLNNFKRAHEAGDGITVSDFGRKYFSEEQYMQVFNHLYTRGYLIDQRGTRTASDGKKKNGHDHMKPKVKGRKFFYLHEKGTHGGQRRNQTRVRPQMEIALRDALIADGLTPNTHSTGLVLFSQEDLKELSA